MKLNHYQHLAMQTGDEYIMKMRDYQDRARTTAVYPRKARIAYPALGLVGELGELSAKINEGANKEEICKEIGDVLWYCANLCCDLERFLSDATGMDTDFDHVGKAYQPLTLEDMGVLSENCKKLVRDGFKEEKVAAVLGTIAYILRYLNAMAIALGTSLNLIASANIAKLESRKERGVLQGDGDNR
jgi:NTP pyrophosphatase (non-canonical NTP hydrolase)